MSSFVAAELFLPNMQMHGMVSVDESQRMSDVFNAADESILMKDVVLTSLGGAKLQSFPELTLDKRQVRAVLPRESSEYVSAHRFARFGVARPTLGNLPVVVVLPPFTGQGLLFLPPPLRLPIAPARLNQFFALLNATVYLDGAVIAECDSLLVNKSWVVGIGPLDAPDAGSREGLFSIVQDSLNGAPATSDTPAESLWPKI